MRLPRKCSINQQAIFARVRKTGRAKAGRFLILSTLEDADLQGVHTGLITSKKSGKAHDRVLLRRRFRALIQAHVPNFTCPNRYLVVIALKDAKQASFEELEADWLRCAKRLRLLKESPVTPAPSI